MGVASTPLTLGDQSGCESPFMGPGMVTVGNPTVFIKGLPGTNLLCPPTGNDMIAPLGAVMVPSVTNVFYSARRRRPRARSTSRRSPRSRARARAGPAEDALLAGGVACAAVPVFSPGLASRVHGALRRLAHVAR